ncbi:MAG: hypothetical protein Q7T83_06000, partial [Thermodesulfovibrionales bacterium]|nr:hypothetical protein [Thermodesulfovibrionales bacterium]
MKLLTSSYNTEVTKGAKVSKVTKGMEGAKVETIETLYPFSPAYMKLFKLFPLFIITLFIVIGCAPVYKANIDYIASEGILWPGQPEKPRIKYLWNLYSLAPRMSFVDFLAGGGDPSDPKASRALVMPYSVYFEGERLYVADSGAMRATVINIKTMEVLQLGLSGKG